MAPSPLTGCCAWHGAELARDDSWVWEWSNAELAEIETALAAARKAGLAWHQVERQDFPIDRVADRLQIEAISDDGVVEAASVAGTESFALSVQWHPEHPLALEWPLSRAMFGAFGEACRQRLASRGGTVRRGGRSRNHAA